MLSLNKNVTDALSSTLKHEFEHHVSDYSLALHMAQPKALPVMTSFSELIEKGQKNLTLFMMKQIDQGDSSVVKAVLKESLLNETHELDFTTSRQALLKSHMHGELQEITYDLAKAQIQLLRTKLEADHKKYSADPCAELLLAFRPKLAYQDKSPGIGEKLMSLFKSVKEEKEIEEPLEEPVEETVEVPVEETNEKHIYGEIPIPPPPPPLDWKASPPKSNLREKLLTEIDHDVDLLLKKPESASRLLHTINETLLSLLDLCIEQSKQPRKLVHAAEQFFDSMTELGAEIATEELYYDTITALLEELSKEESTQKPITDGDTYQTTETMEITETTELSEMTENIKVINETIEIVNTIEIDDEILTERKDVLLIPDDRHRNSGDSPSNRSEDSFSSFLMTPPEDLIQSENQVTFNLYEKWQQIKITLQEQKLNGIPKDTSSVKRQPRVWNYGVKSKQ